VRIARLAALLLALYAVACGGTSRYDAGSGGSSGAAGAFAGVDASPGTGGACPKPVSAVPAVPPFEAPPVGALGAFQVTFHNRCAETVWPAWGSGGGLDNSVIDTQLWFPLSSGSDRAVTVYGGVRDIGVWGRTGCSFDQQGGGACQTGDCGGFVCPIQVNAFPTNATVFVLRRGFRTGYNVSLRVEGPACGSRDCIADVSSCSPAFAVDDACRGIIACSDMCSSRAECCSTTDSACGAEQFNDTPDSDHLDITFCP
jgi:hypothetical protein